MVVNDELNKESKHCSAKMLRLSKSLEQVIENEIRVHYLLSVIMDVYSYWPFSIAGFNTWALSAIQRRSWRRYLLLLQSIKMTGNLLTPQPITYSILNSNLIRFRYTVDVWIYNAVKTITWTLLTYLKYFLTLCFYCRSLPSRHIHEWLSNLSDRDPAPPAPLGRQTGGTAELSHTNHQGHHRLSQDQDF